MKMNYVLIIHRKMWNTQGNQLFVVQQCHNSFKIWLLPRVLHLSKKIHELTSCPQQFAKLDLNACTNASY
jgi:hypothetical protein